ncbi:MAG: sugar phosphate isomerase/epimerase [Treponema sp.]|jgi:sugar phosphate isomerase/epimerase|nr:sugar phosphate isomerase/epimerase [Treponema sp.]
MQIGVSAYSFSPLIKGGKFTLFDAVNSAKEIGYDSIEFTGLESPPGKSLPDFAEELRNACEKAGLSISCYAVSADFLNGSGGDSKAEAERIKGAVDIARILGVPCLRHDASWGIKETAPAGCRTYRDAIRIVAPAIREVTEYAARYGIRTMTENHGYFLQESSRVEKLVLAVDHPNYGLLVDIGNFMCADESSTAALPAVMPYAFHVHAKDFLLKSGAEPRPDSSWFPTRAGNWLRGTILGHGVVSVAQCLDFIKKSGYNGSISLEFEGPEEPIAAIRRGFEFLKVHC